jgi:hypothetical protein
MDRSYFARQLNGPIITAFFTAVYNFLYEYCGFKKLLGYFRELSIATAEKNQLNFIGSLMGLQRFSVRGADTSDKNSITYTSDYADQAVYPEAIGFSDEYTEQDPDDPKYGKFTNSYAGTGEVLPIPQEGFRSLLLVIADYGDFLSMKAILAIIRAGLDGIEDFELMRDTEVNDSFIVRTGNTITPVMQLQLNIILSSVYAGYLQFNIESME